MERVNVSIKARKHVAEKLKIDFKDFSCHLNQNDSLVITGGMFPKAEYKEIDGYYLKIKADVVDKEGCILSTASSWEDFCLEFSGYESFELFISSNERWYDLTEIAEIKVYGVYRKKD